MKTTVLASVAAIGIAFGSTNPTKAEMTDLEVLFVKADERGDFLLDVGEVVQITIIHFRLVDSDRDGLLEKQEIGDLADNVEFSDNDENQNGALSLEEVIAEKMSDFKAADTNGDGLLDFDEVANSYER